MTDKTIFNIRDIIDKHDIVNKNNSFAFIHTGLKDICKCAGERRDYLVRASTKLFDYENEYSKLDKDGDILNKFIEDFSERYQLCLIRTREDLSDILKKLDVLIQGGKDE